MTPDAKIERVEADVWAALEFLEQAKRFLRDGETETISDEGRQLLHSAAIAGCDAILAIAGWQVSGVEGGHVLRLTETHKSLGGGHDELFDRLDDSRSRRANASYRAGLVSAVEIDPAVAAVRELVKTAEDFIEPRLPPWA